jgi:methylglutaconyl-CoA hydratase
MKRTGEYAAKYYMLTGKIFDVKNALRMGLVDFSGNEEHLYSELEHLLNELDKNSVQAVRQTKKLLHEISRSVNMNQIKNMTLDAIAKARISKDGQEGMKAFLEKRKPVWRKDRK